MSSYIDDAYAHNGNLYAHSWRDFTHERLTVIYGPDRADRIMAGQDPKTQADLRAWNTLGRRDAA